MEMAAEMQKLLFPTNLPNDEKVQITIYSVDGTKVKQIEQSFKAGRNSVPIKRADLIASGVYYYEIQTDNFTAAKKMILIE